MPSDESVRPGLPAPPAILVPWALYLCVPWLLFATFGAYWRGPVRAIEQSDPIEEGHLAQLLGLLQHLDFDLYLDLGRSAIRTPCLFVLPVTA